MWTWLRALALVMVVAVAASACSGPAEVHTPAAGSYPSMPSASAGTMRALRSAPLIVDGRLRVFADRHELTADGPVDAAARANPPYWSIQRTDVDLHAVVAIGPSVVSLWSDGELIALDAHTGAISWRAPTARSAGGYPGRRTGADVVYQYEQLLTARTAAGRLVVLRVVDGQAWGFDASTGALLWHIEFDGPRPNCRLFGFTTTSGAYVTVDYCNDRSRAELYDVANGALQRTWTPPGAESELGPFPTGCRLRRSECRAVAIRDRSGVFHTWAFDTPTPVEARGAPTERAMIGGSVGAEPADLLAGSPEVFVGRDLLSGRERWLWTAPPGGASLIAATNDAFHLITPGRDLITVDASTGLTRSAVSLVSAGEDPDWTTGAVYASDGFVVIERLLIGDSIADDDSYYYSEQPVLLVAT